MPKIKLTKEEESLLVEKDGLHYIPMLLKKIGSGEYELIEPKSFEGKMIELLVGKPLHDSSVFYSDFEKIKSASGIPIADNKVDGSRITNNTI